MNIYKIQNKNYSYTELVLKSTPDNSLHLASLPRKNNSACFTYVFIV